jgi:hypothetical protein
MAKKAKQAVKKVARKAAAKKTATIGGVSIRVAGTAPKTAKARGIRRAVQAYYG